MNKGLFQTLFDFSFTEFVTTRMIKILFFVGIVIAALGALALIGKGFNDGFFSGIIMLLIAPIVFLIYVLLVRVWCEMIIVIFRIAENTSRMVGKNTDQPS
jgi:hypothetical protein